jgi:two-component system CheB/CheR fusion protein
MNDLKQTATSPSSLQFPVVGIGASAGGLGALLRLFENMPADNGMAFVVVLHLSPTHESNIALLLQNSTKMPVQQVVGPVKIEKNHVYVIPPSRSLLMRDGQLLVEPMVRPRGRAVAIDVFFRTLADAHAERSVGVILSGTGSDGAVGISRIKEVGGVTIAQDPKDAEYDGMPYSAIETRAIDFVLPIGEMPQRLIEISDNRVHIKLPSASALAIDVQDESPDDKKAAEDALIEIMDLLRSRSGHDFSHYKKATVLRRIERRMQVSRTASLQEYFRFLTDHLDETPSLLQDMLISVTNFFRDRESFETLEREYIPSIFSEAEKGSPIRVWSAGCATGEEAYSLGMLLAEQRVLLNSSVDIQVFATDIDDRAISIARRGLYPESIVTDVAPSKLRQFFIREDGHYRIKKTLREKVLFAAHNILRDPPFSRVHLISCRNLLIYLNREVQEKVFEMFHFALVPGGYLYLGSSESAEVASKYFTPVDKKNRVYRAIVMTRSAQYLPPIPHRRHGPVEISNYIAVEQRPAVRYAELHQQLIEQYAPPSVLINRSGEVVHVTKTAGKYLRYPTGEPSHDLVALIVPELRLELRTALFQVQQSGMNAETRNVPFEHNGQQLNVALTMRVIPNESQQNQFILILFNESTRDAPIDYQGESGTSFIAKQLENELFITKGQLQTTIEQYETSAEELKASNEELQAINEELRSTTEELETSKEELQSINEELITVNHELKIKVDETGKSNDDLQNFISATEIATIFVDRAMHIKRYTPRSADIFKLIPTDIGRPLLDISHRLDYELLEDDAARVFETLRPCEREVKSDTGNRYIARLIPYRTNEDQISGLVLTFIDITSLHQVQSRLAAEELRMRVVAASTRDYAIITMDLAGRITFWNSGAERIFGYNETEVIGQHIDLIFTPEDKDNQIPALELTTAKKEGRSSDERWHLRKNGSKVFCSGIVTRLDDDEVKGYAKIARDLTSTKELETKREARLVMERATRLKAEEAVRLREEFLAVLSHELKHPLNLIQLNAELLKRIPSVQDQAQITRIADVIRSTVQTQAKIIDDLLDLSRAQTGKLTLKKTLVDIASITEKITRVFEVDAKNKSIELLYQSALPSLLVFGDATRLEQVLWNLLSNAIKFTPSGGKVSISLERDGSNALIIVSDSGKGIAAHFLPHIFRMFEQADAVTTREHGGLGIGLALVRQLAESHGGRVEVKSDGLGQGAEFSVWLPLHDGDQADAPAEPIDEELNLLGGKTLLLVDDHIENLETLRDLLASHGAVVIAKNSGAEALAEVAKHRFDLIVSDIAMPKMDGYEFLKRLRQHPDGNDIPVIALTGFGRAIDVQTALKKGFTAHLQKPIDLKGFAEVVRAIFNGDVS